MTRENASGRPMRYRPLEDTCGLRALVRALVNTSEEVHDLDRMSRAWVLLVVEDIGRAAYKDKGKALVERAEGSIAGDEKVVGLGQQTQERS